MNLLESCFELIPERFRSKKKRMDHFFKSIPKLSALPGTMVLTKLGSIWNMERLLISLVLKRNIRQSASSIFIKIRLLQIYVMSRQVGNFALFQIILTVEMEGW